MKLISTRTLLPFAMLVAVAASLLAPSSASAILAGAESNRELVNSDRTPALQRIALDKMKKQGVQVVRGNFGWNEVATSKCKGKSITQLSNHRNSCYNWKIFDSFVKQANQRRIQVLISITRVPTWVINSTPENMGRTGPQFTKVLRNYVAFHKAAATRYKAGSKYGFIQYWTIHNEPNSKTYWGPRPNPNWYAMLYGKTAVAIKRAHKTALVAPGPTGPTGGSGGMKPLAFMRAFQAKVPKYLPGSMPMKRRYLNAWAHNPYPGSRSQPSVASNTTSHRDSVGMAKIDNLFKQLDKAPITRGTRVWATEFGWETSGTLKVSMAQQAQFIAEAFDWLDRKRRVTIGISYGLTDPKEAYDWQSGTFSSNGRIKPSFKMFQRMVSVPQGGKGGVVRRGTVVKVWGRSNISPRTGVLAFSIPGRQCAPGRMWCTVRGQRRKGDGSITAMMRVTTPKIRFSVWSKGIPKLKIKAGYGMARSLRTN